MKKAWHDPNRSPVLTQLQQINLTDRKKKSKLTSQEYSSEKGEGQTQPQPGDPVTINSGKSC